MSAIVDGIDTSNFLKAVQVFESFRQHLDTDQEQVGAIQAFKCAYEMAWKTMKRVLEKRGVDVRSPRDCFREAALTCLISDPEQWFIFLEKRNLTSHTYKKENAQSIVKIFGPFSKALSELIKNLQPAEPLLIRCVRTRSVSCSTMPSN